MRRRYGAGPLHLLAHLALLPLCAWGLLQLFKVSSSTADVRIATWLVAAVILHDLFVLPLYTAADGGVQLAVRRTAVNYIRIPAALSLLMLVVFYATIGGRGAHTYHAVSGQSFEGYATRWLLVSAALFAGSGLLYLLRGRGGGSSS